MIKYYAIAWRGTIHSVEVARETTKTLTIEYPNGCFRRYPKRSFESNYFATFQEAKDFLLDHAQKKLESAEDEANKARRILAKVESLQE